VTLKPGLGVTQGHRKLYHSIRHRSIVTIGLYRTVSEINGVIRRKSSMFPTTRVRKPSGDKFQSGSKLVSSNAPTYDFYLRELLRSELTYLLT